jgi:hypothetical protein
MRLSRDRGSFRASVQDVDAFFRFGELGLGPVCLLVQKSLGSVEK